MAITLNAKGTSVPYFKIGKSGTTLFQGNEDPHVSGGYSVQTNDIWFDTAGKTLKFRTSGQTWQALAEADKISEMTDVDLNGLADGHFLRYDGSSNSWTTYAVTGGLANDWGSIAENGITVDGYTGDIWQFETQTGMLSHTGPVTVNGSLVATSIVSDSIPSDVNELADADGLLNHVSNTDSLVEGTNLFYTDARVEAHLDSGTSTPNLDTLNVSGVINANGSGNSLLISDTLRIAQNGSGLRMTNVGAFDNDGSNNFRLFSTNDLILSANGDSNTALTVDGGTRNITINNDLQVDGAVSTPTATVDDLQVNDSMVLPKGTAGERPSTAVEGMMWFNTTTKKFEGYDGTSWIVFSPEDWGSIA